ncbi:glycosyltransferase family 2 protein [Agarivorans albus]|uniref:Alpha-L-Rha alpha-1,3-L-rhamnosyltransferase n=1 Tax=Agarivorans albus MKT 106 TaxID=1331007 RepID=R9PMZ1_AGAAL|nr:glycosyltransferase family 2 protein [Agarivorans albus]GAD02747.1 alpha-L-Rha alpha-1,3-L-rhamnosyltransferase [Agarivorans albus MKT 106]
MTSFNGEKYIEEQIVSILEQITFEDELLISDDGSTDETTNIIESFVRNDSRVKLLHGPKAGLQSNFDFVLSQASGEYIFLSDQDDVWLPDKVKLTLSKLEIYNLVVSDCYIVDDKLRIISDSFYESNGLRVGVFSNLYKNSFLGCCMAFDRKILDCVLPFPKNIPMHDWWIGLVSSVKFNVKFTDEKLIYYRRHSSNASPTSQKSTNSLIVKIRHRIFLGTQVLFRLLNY